MTAMNSNGPNFEQHSKGGSGMPELPSILTKADGDRGTAAILLMSSAMIAMDSYSTLMSSPWTVNNVGANPEQAASAREYYRHALLVSMALAVAAAWVAPRTIWWFPILGSGAANAYLIWLYERAIRRAQAKGGQSAFGSLSRS